jgi:PKD repeat protein
MGSINGSNSYDSSGLALQFSWRMLSGPGNPFFQSPTQQLCNLTSISAQGVYSFELKVSNNNGTDSDTMNISVATPAYCQPTRSEVPVGLTFLSNVPTQIQGAEVIAAGNKLFIPAWFSNASGTYSNNIHVYDRTTQNWTTIQASMARTGVSSVAAGGKVFFAGGIDAGFNVTPVVDIYDLATNSWTVTNLSEAKGFCEAVVQGNKIYFAGGLKDNHVLSDKVEIYDLVTGTWSSTSLPGGARIVGAVLAVPNKVLFCGGYTRYEDVTMGYVPTTPTSTIDIYDVNTGGWSTTNMQFKKGSFAAISLNEKVLLAGGEISSHPTFHVEELNVSTMNSVNSCLIQPMLGDARTAVQVNDKLLLFAYARGFTGIQDNKFDIYNISTGEWSVGVLPLGLVPTGAFTGIVSVNDGVFTVINDKLYRMNL